jgi:glycosyltransferase involved in cell wall biosynthesis
MALLGSYVPRQCGIGTFTKDLRDALADTLGQRQVTVLAMDDTLEGYAYPDEVRFQIPAHDRKQYRTAAEMLNINQIDVAIVQHEYGIYGGRDGSYVLDLLRRVRMPVITTMHTVLREPSEGQRKVTHELIRYSDRLVVMSRLAERILEETYDASPEKIVYIPHGIPDVPFSDSSFFKDQFGFQGRTVLLTFGLLSPGKGIGVAIKAMPKIVERHPDVIYVILGATHPNVLKNEGNNYRHSLERLVTKLGMTEHVTFHDRFVTKDELLGYLGATDVYVTPYPNKQQITSGTLAYAVGSGKAVVSTPYWHAEEMLADGRGRLFPFNDSEALAQTVNELLDDDEQRDAIRKQAYMHGRSMVWEQVARDYIETAKEVIVDRDRQPRPVLVGAVKDRPDAAMPELTLNHLRRLTDDTGIFQHAIYATPNRDHGYCTDDNARALVAALMYCDLRRDETILRMADIYLSFLHHAFNPQTRRFRNFMTFDRRWTEEVGSEDVHGRAVWAIGLTASLAPSDALLSFATRLLHEALEPLERFSSPRAWAFALVGVHAYLERFAGDTYGRRVRDMLAERLYRMFRDNAADDWPWCEDVVTYDNAKLPHALILGGQWIPDQGMLEQGLRSLEWLVRLQLDEQGNVSLIGNHGWLRRDGHQARFDQQPVEAMAMISACAEAYRATQDDIWFQRSRHFLDWFTGSNDTQSVLYDYHTGGCRDGLHPDGPNLNQGAESTLAWLISLMTVMTQLRERDAAGRQAGAAQQPVESASG